jgi:hypothetical protein
MPGCTMTAGRRRKSRKGRRSMRGGMFYGVGSAITPGALEYNAVSGSRPVNSATGADEVDPFGTVTKGGDSVILGGRRRKSRKGKKSRKVRRTRKMRGGGWTPGGVNSAIAGTSFVGAQPGMPGSQGRGGYVGYNARTAGGPTAGPDGVMKV